MRFVFVGGSNQVTANVQYNNVVGGASWSYLATRQQVVPCYAEFSNLRCAITTAPGSGFTQNFTLYKNGAATSLTVAIANTSTTGSDATHTVTVNAGDAIAIYSSKTGGLSNISKWSMFVDTTTNANSTSFVMSGLGTSQTGTCYLPIVGGKVTAASDARSYRMPMPFQGTFTAMVAKTHVNVGAGSLVSTLYKNNAATALACTINAGYAASTCNADVSFVQGDLCVLRFTTIGAMTTSLSASVGMVVNSNTPGDYLMGGACITMQTTWVSELATGFCSSATTWIAGELNTRGQYCNTTTLKNINYILQSAPGASQSIVYAVAINGTDRFITTISGTSTVGALVESNNISNMSTLEMRCWNIGTPTGACAGWAVTANQGGSKSLPENNVLTGSLSKGLRVKRSVSESGVLTDTVNKVARRVRGLPSEATVLLDTLTSSSTRVRSLSDTTTLTDSCSPKISRKYLLDGATLNDSVSKILRINKILSETILETENTNRNVTNIRYQTETLTDNLSRQIRRSIFLSDSNILSDQCSQVASGIISTVIANADVLTDNIARKTRLQRIFVENIIAHGDVSSAKTGYPTTVIGEATVLTADINKRIKSARTLSESIVESDALLQPSLTTPGLSIPPLIFPFTFAPEAPMGKSTVNANTDVLTDTQYCRRPNTHLTLSEILTYADYCIPPDSGLFPLKYPFKFAKAPAATSIKAETLVLLESLSRNVSTKRFISGTPVLTDQLSSSVISIYHTTSLANSITFSEQWSYNIVSKYKSTTLAETIVETSTPLKGLRGSKTLFDGPLLGDIIVVPLAPIVTISVQKYPWQLNDLELPNTYITTRKITSPWASQTLNVYAQKAVVINPNQLAQPVTIGISIVGANRFAIESSIRAELEQCRCIQLKTVPPNYIYDDNRFVLFEPQSFVVEDSLQMLKCRLNGFIDERTLTTGNYIAGWSTTAGEPSIVDGNKFGKKCFRSQINDSIGYTFPEPVDLSNATKICFWLKCDLSSNALTTSEFYIYNGINYYGWSITFPANVWTYIEVNMAQADSHSLSLPNLTNITQFRFALLPNNQTKYVYLSWIFMN
jgi:hypothetical protein